MKEVKKLINRALSRLNNPGIVDLENPLFARLTEQLLAAQKTVLYIESLQKPHKIGERKPS